MKYRIITQYDDDIKLCLKEKSYCILSRMNLCIKLTSVLYLENLFTPFLVSK